MGAIDQNRTEPYRFQIDVPVSQRAAKPIDIGQMTAWCRTTLGQQGWNQRNRREAVRYSFQSEEFAAKFAREWGRQL
ncbi:MAG: hypothetical protein K8R18_00110 [Parvibaculum sp.]|uniref:hypothetical protein n=1 Tax=Parvibaculum sp. TaxID=2024848 RepID=UPI0025D3017E|nr:hypothetical protein [Parvibaculum sp.]MCE9647999.1 hypothetical protein [Parvibaculum sp.]